MTGWRSVSWRLSELEYTFSRLEDPWLLALLPGILIYSAALLSLGLWVRLPSYVALKLGSALRT